MSVASQFIGFYTLVRKESVRFLRIWAQSLLPPAITTTLYFVIFGRVIGSQINNVQGYTYIQFILPGLLMMGLINAAYMNSSSSFFGAKFGRHIEEVLTSPMSNNAVLLGYVVSSALRGILVGIVVGIIGMFFTHLHVKHMLAMVVVALLTATLFALAGLINGIFARKFDDVSIVPTFILTPLIYLGGVFYPIAALPIFWQHVSLLNPIFYVIDAFRYSLLGLSGVNIIYCLAAIVGTNIVLYLLALRLLKKSVGLRH